MKLFNSKKGFNITEVPTLAVVLLVIAIIIGIGGTILSNMREAEVGSSSVFDTNSTFTTINQTEVNFATENKYDSVGNDHLLAGTCTGAIIVNGSNLVDVTSDFTVAGCTALLTNNLINNTLVTVNYTYSYNTYSTSYNITSQGLDAQSDLSDWQSTWVVIVAAAVVLGIVGRYLFFKS